MCVSRLGRRGLGSVTGKTPLLKIIESQCLRNCSSNHYLHNSIILQFLFSKMQNIVFIELDVFNISCKIETSEPDIFVSLFLQFPILPRHEKFETCRKAKHNGVLRRIIS